MIVYLPSNFFTPDCSSVFHNCTMYTMYFWMHTKRKKKPNYHHRINKTSLICVLLILMNRIIDTRKKNLKKNFQLENKNLCWNDRQTRIKVWIKTNIFLTYTTDDLNMSVDIYQWEYRFTNGRILTLTDCGLHINLSGPATSRPSVRSSTKKTLSSSLNVN